MAGAGDQVAVFGIRGEHRAGDQVGRAAVADVPGLPGEPVAVQRARQGLQRRRHRAHRLHAGGQGRARRAAADAHLQFEYRPADVGDAG